MGSVLNKIGARTEHTPCDAEKRGTRNKKEERKKEERKDEGKISTKKKR